MAPGEQAMSAFLANRLDQAMAPLPGTQGNRSDSCEFGDGANGVQLFTGIFVWFYFCVH
jgi:hypothetical protein